jgi:GDP-4-dehydro-6-deoxy-D-mannose reductase
MKKIMITGVDGFVGKHVAAELIANGYEVVGIGGRDTKNIITGLASYQKLNLANIEEVSRIEFAGVDAVIHLAGIAAVGPSFENPMLYIDTNSRIESNLFEIAKIQNVKPRFLIISSGSLYSPSSNLPLIETSSVLPNSPYAVSKLTQEQLGVYYMKLGFEVIIARPFNHIGPGQDSGFIVPDIAKQIIEIEKNGDNKLLTGNLSAQRDYTDVRDIARAYRLLIERGVKGEIYNVCSGKPISGTEIVRGLLKYSPKKITTSVDPLKLRPIDTPLVYGSYEKISKQTGWKPEIELSQTLGDVMDDWRSRN